MSAIEPQNSLLVPSVLAYAMTSQEQLFVDGVVTPLLRNSMTGLQTDMGEDLTKDFMSIFAELNLELINPRETLKAQALFLRGELLTWVDIKNWPIF